MWLIEDAPWWKRWPVFLWIAVSVGLVVLCRVVTGLFGRTRSDSAGGASGAVDATMDHYQQSKQDASQELSQLDQAMDAADSAATQARDDAREAAKTREEQHAAIDAADSGDAVDAVLYGQRTDD
jgi:hypothetical protein